MVPAYTDLKLHDMPDPSKPSLHALSADDQNAVIEFLKSLQVLPPGAKSLVVDERGHPKRWPPSTDSSEEER